MRHWPALRACFLMREPNQDQGGPEQVGQYFQVFAEGVKEQQQYHGQADPCAGVIACLEQQVDETHQHGNGQCQQADHAFDEQQSVPAVVRADGHVLNQVWPALDDAMPP